jgi:superfamily I DNA/RNA helicase
MQLIAEMTAGGHRIPGGESRQITQRIAVMYDEYVARMQQVQLLDFDDLLHQCLALLNDNPQVSFVRLLVCYVISLLDSDDMLYHCLALLHDNSQARVAS